MPPLGGGTRLVCKPRHDEGVVRVAVIPRGGRHLHLAEKPGCLAKPRVNAVAACWRERADGVEHLPGFVAEFPREKLIVERLLEVAAIAVKLAERLALEQFAQLGQAGTELGQAGPARVG